MKGKLTRLGKMTYSKHSKSMVVGITGGTGTGKTIISKTLERYCENQSINCLIIEIDKLEHESFKNPIIKKKLVTSFGKDILDDFGEIYRPRLRKKEFSSEENELLFQQIVTPYISNRTSNTIENFSGLVLIDAAVLIEYGYTKLCNNNFILVNTNMSIREARLKNRGYDKQAINAMISLQLPFKERKKILEKKLTHSSCGNLWIFENNDCNQYEFKKKVNQLTKTILLYGEMIHDI